MLLVVHINEAKDVTIGERGRGLPALGVQLVSEYPSRLSRQSTNKQKQRQQDCSSRGTDHWPLASAKFYPGLSHGAISQGASMNLMGNVAAISAAFRGNSRSSA
ncbi:MAG: hypothetical protein E5X67_21015 [Mesorhizobium sp.]|uniref:hypothetical protein n=1 Tax=Mesorhizobium sp. TaxID=1871066 RepID=UPI001228D03A|nr:hypothetical protein [Mesorhizobium sp.]TIP26244.1 MAG: hypothetical protein E5X67_21015 [Mesorhizobium sp.]